jgi:hypothetical protein
LLQPFQLLLLVLVAAVWGVIGRVVQPNKVVVVEVLTLLVQALLAQLGVPVLE